MKQAVSFLKLKLTNNALDQHGHVSIFLTKILGSLVKVLRNGLNLLNDFLSGILIKSDIPT